jgi:hypothetical protein
MSPDKGTRCAGWKSPPWLLLFREAALQSKVLNTGCPAATCALMNQSVAEKKLFGLDATVVMDLGSKRGSKGGHVVV